MESDCYPLLLILTDEEFNLALTLTETKRNQQVQDCDYSPGNR